MLPEKLPLWAKLIGYLFGAGLLFIGGRFLVAPENGRTWIRPDLRPTE